MSAIKDKLTQVVEPLLASLGLKLWGLEYLPASRSILRIYIERAEAAGPQAERSEPAQALRSEQTEAEHSKPDEALRNEQTEAERSEPAQAMRSEQTEAEHSEPDEALRNEQAGIDECAHASRLIGLALDVEDIIPGSYVLEVSTPGLERLFFSPEQLGRYYGALVDLSLLAPEAEHPGRKRFTGRLGRSELKNFCLELLAPADFTPEDAPPLHFDWSNVKKARLIYQTPEKKGAPKAKEPRRKK